MNNPFNEIDFERFKKIADLMAADGNGDIRLYISESLDTGKAYVHIEMSSHAIAYDSIRDVMRLSIEELFTPKQV